MRRTFFILFLLAIGLLTASGVTDNAPEYHRVKARPGDGVMKLLRRYHLDAPACNVDRFYELNRLDRKAGLLSGRYYKLPVLIYRYDGTSIRSTIGEPDNWDKARRIQAYNKRILKEKLRRQTYQSSKILWVPYHEVSCGTPATNPAPVATSGEADPDEGETVSARRYYPIFGEKHSYIALKSNKLQGKVYYVVGGHGGPDPGAIGKYAGKLICEDEYAYDISLRLARNLIRHGATVYVITRDRNDGIREEKILPCDKDERTYKNKRMSSRQKPRLFQRSNTINELYRKHKRQGVTDQTTICIHIDSRNQRQSADLFFYYFPKSRSSKKLAREMHKVMRAKYKKYRKSGRYSGTVSGRDLHMLREPKTKAVYVEVGNIRNANDQKRIVLASNRQALADWLFEGMSGFPIK